MTIDTSNTMLNAQAQIAVDKAKLLSGQMDTNKGGKIATSRGSFVDTSRLNTEENLDKALEQFEAIFVRMMLKSARKATESNEEGLFSNSGLKQFRSMQDDEWADSFAKSSNLGIAEALKRQLAGPNSAFEAGVKAQQKTNPNSLAGKTLDGASLKQQYMKLAKEVDYMNIENSDNLVNNKFMSLK